MYKNVFKAITAAVLLGSVIGFFVSCQNAAVPPPQKNKKTVTLTFQLNGGTTATPLKNGTLTGLPGEQLAIKDPVKDNFIFKKWEPSLPKVFPASDTTYTAVWEEAVSAAPKLEEFTASDFKGLFAKDVKRNVINSEIKWKALPNADYYNVFINGKQTNDPEDGKLTETKFKTAEGTIDLDKEMGDKEKEVRIMVRAYSTNSEVIAESSVIKKLPIKNKIGTITINGQPYSENMEIENPCVVQIALNNGIKEMDSSEAKAYAICRQYVMIEKYGDPVACDITYDRSAQVLQLKAQGALKEGIPHTLTLKKGFCDRSNMYYAEENKVFRLKIKKMNNPPTLAVDKVLINDDPNMDITTASKPNIPVNSTVSIYFNQLIDTSTYMPSSESEGGTKGTGIYITTKDSGKGDDPSRLTDALFENVQVGDKFVSKVTFKMVGKLFLTMDPEPLNGNTKYHIVVETDIKSGAGTKLAEEKRYSFFTGAAVAIPHTLTVQGGKITGKTEAPFNEKKITAGEQVTIEAIIPEGKTFASWYVNDDDWVKLKLTDGDKKKNPLTFTMINEDITFTAEFN